MEGWKDVDAGDEDLEGGGITFGVCLAKKGGDADVVVDEVGNADGKVVVVVVFIVFLTEEVEEDVDIFEEVEVEDDMIASNSLMSFLSVMEYFFLISSSSIYP